MAKSNKITARWFEENVVGIDAVNKRDGIFTVRKGYFYRSGSPESFAERITQQLNNHNIKHEVVDHGDHWAPFKGGASVAKSSHYWVKIRIIEE